MIEDHKIGFLPPIVKGDVDAAIDAAEIRFDQTYTTPPHFPAALEPHAATAWWEGDTLMLRASLQVLGAPRRRSPRRSGSTRPRSASSRPMSAAGSAGRPGSGPKR